MKEFGHNLFLVVLVYAAVLSVWQEESAQAGESVTIVALGDSTTAGAPAFRSPREVPPNGEGDPQSQYAYWVNQKRPDWQVLNRGVSGERSDEILARFDADVLSARPRAVVVLAGVNDLYQGRSSEWVKAHLEQIYARAHRAGIQVLACTILPFNGSSPEVQLGMKEVNDWIKMYAAGHGLGFCDTFSALQHPDKPHHLAGTQDGIHPDPDTYAHMGGVIEKALARLLQADR